MVAMAAFLPMFFTSKGNNIMTNEPRHNDMQRINLEEKFNLFDDHWSPKIIGELNDSYVKLAKFKGEFTWHKHDNEDEMFLVVKGKLLIKLRDKDVHLNEGELFIVPKGVEHMPISDEESHILLLEPKSTLNTGNQRNNKTIEKLDKI